MMNESNLSHLSGPGIVTVDVPSVRTHRNRRPISVPNMVKLKVQSHNDTDKLVILHTENGDQYVIRTDMLLVAINNTKQTTRIREVVEIS